MYGVADAVKAFLSGKVNMSIYKIADLLINIPCKSEYTKNMMAGYLTDSQSCELSIEITDEDIKREQGIVKGFTYGIYEFTAILRRLSNILLMSYDGILLHSAIIAYKGKAYAFTAPSGTGEFVWNLLQNDVDYDFVINRLCDTYEVDEKNARADFDEFLTTVRKAGLLNE